MLGGAVAGLPTSAAAAASAAAVAVAAHKQFHPNSPPLDLDSWKEAFLQQANNNTNGNPNKNVRAHYDYQLHCKFLQGTIGSLQGNQATGISYLQGFSIYVITCKEFIGIISNNYRDFYCFL